MRKKVNGAIPYLVLGGVLLLAVLLNVFCHDHWLDSDMAAEMMFSKLLAEEGRWFATPDWYYSTEFRFLYTHWIMGPLFRVLRDWHVIRLITNILSYLFLLASYYFFMKPFRVRKSLVVTTSAILLLPFSETMMTHMLLGNTYIFHVVIVFLFFGLFFRLAANKKKSGRLGWWICFLALALVCGVSGVRYLLALQCPLTITTFLCLLRTSEFERFRKGLQPRRTRGLWIPLWKCAAMKYFLCSLAGAFGSLAGYAINVLYVSKQYVFQTYEATNFIPIYRGVLMERLQNAIGCLLMFFGYIPDRGVISLRGLVTLIAFVLIGVFGYCVARVYKGVHGQRFFICLFLVVSFVLNLFVFVFTTSTMVPRYYITLFVFALPVLCFYLEKEELFFDRLAVCLLLTGCLAVASGKTVLSYLSVDKNADRRPVARFLQENGYTFGYASYWNANILTELTDGGVEIANVGDARELEYFKWSSPVKYYESGYHTGEVFLLLTREEASEADKCAAIEQGRVVYEDDSYVALVYDSSESLMRLAGRDGK